MWRNDDGDPGAWLLIDDCVIDDCGLRPHKIWRKKCHLPRKDDDETLEDVPAQLCPLQWCRMAVRT